MRISIVMATYNGEKYLKEQLNSLLNQTRQVDEVIICDDNSKDNTVNIINQFMVDNKLNNWKIYKNKFNIGWQRNFINAFDRATGDIIFCADQDDIWLDDKVESMVKCMEDNTNIMVLGGGTIIVDEQNKPFKKRIGVSVKSKNTGSIFRANFDEKYFLSLQPGCAICFRRILLDKVKQMWFMNYPHDQILWNLAHIIDGAYLLDKEVIRYRRHKNSVFEGSKRSGKNRLMKYYRTKKVIEQCKEFVIKNDVPNKSVKMDLINRSQKWINYRIELIENKKLINAIKLLRYIRIYNYKFLYIVDLIDAFGVKKQNLYKP